MTTKTLTGYYAGYSLKANYSGLTITDTALIGSGGVSVNSDAYVTNSGGISASSFRSGVYLYDGGTVKNTVGGSISSSGGYNPGIDGVASKEVGNVVNDGYIGGYVDGIALLAGGRVTNSANIHGNNFGVYTRSGAATVTNLGAVTSGALAGGVGVSLGDGGRVINGGLGDTKAEIEGGNNAVVVGAGGTVDNFGILTVSGRYPNINGPAVELSGAATLVNGAPTDQVATISAGNGVWSPLLSNATVTNFGTILATAGPDYGGSTGVSIFAGDVTNGGAADTVAIIKGFNAVTAGDANKVINFGTMDGTGVGAHSGYHGVLLKEGGYLTNGSTGDPTALIQGAYGVEVQGYAGAVKNFGAILATEAGVVVSGAVVSGGDVVNETTSSLIRGVTFGIEAEDAALTVTNFGTVLATGGASGNWGVSLAAGGKLTNGSPTNAGALIEGYGGVDLQGHAPLATNFGTITATGRYGYGAVLGAGAHFTNGAKGDTTATIQGYRGVSAAGAAATVTNFGTITGYSRTAVQFNAPSDVLVVEAGSVFEGTADGDGGTIVLASGTGSVSLPGLESLTVSGSMAPTAFSSFATVEIGAAATFTTAGVATISAGSLLSNAGELTVAEALTNAGVLSATGGTLTVDGAVTGAGTVRIYAGTADFAGAFNENVDFAATAGVLELADSQTYSGKITGLSKTGSNSVELADIDFAHAPTWGYSGTTTSGVLTVGDTLGHTAKITLEGDYLGSTFVLSAGPGIGTKVVDPPSGRGSISRFIAAAAGFAGSRAAGQTALNGDGWRPPSPPLIHGA